MSPATTVWDVATAATAATAATGASVGLDVVGIVRTWPIWIRATSDSALALAIAPTDTPERSAIWLTVSPCLTT